MNSKAHTIGRNGGEEGGCCEGRLFALNVRKKQQLGNQTLGLTGWKTEAS